MGQFNPHQDFVALNQGNSCGLRTRIDLDFDRLPLGFFHGPFQNEGKGKAA
jgi:hypothetical protein